MPDKHSPPQVFEYYRLLEPGRYGTWNLSHSVELLEIDGRPSIRIADTHLEDDFEILSYDEETQELLYIHELHNIPTRIVTDTPPECRYRAQARFAEKPPYSRGLEKILSALQDIFRAGLRKSSSDESIYDEMDYVPFRWKD